MKRISLLVLLVVIMSGCTGGKALSSGGATAMIKDDIIEGDGVMELPGETSLRNAPDGVKEIILRVKNNTNKGLWVPDSDGKRGQINCEGVSLKEIDKNGLYGISHSDHGICKFPDQYKRLKPGESCEYVYGITSKKLGKVNISIWAPWRTENGELIDREIKKAALKDGDMLIEKVEGAGFLQID
ncbi:MAG: hypothetical protein WAX69_26470 [Victivallales bacterium]